MSILKFDSDIPEIGLTTRKSKEGEEFELVEKYCGTNLSNLNGSHALFIEPKIANSFPDIVLVEYDKNTFTKWTQERGELNKQDLKLLNYFYRNNGIQSSDLINKLGYKSREVLRSIEKLLDSEILFRSNKRWFVRKNRAFGIKSIKAIEAKISNLSNAFKQAKQNKWFASESYILTTVTKPAKKTLDTSKKYGVGFYSMADDKISEKSKAVQQGLPLSHASWYFNEWIGRYMNQK